MIAALLILGAACNVALLAGPWFLMLVYREVLPARSGGLLVDLLVLLALVQVLAVLLDWARSRALARLGLAAALSCLETEACETGLAPPRPGRRRPAGGKGVDPSAAGDLARPEAAVLLDLPWTPIFLGLLGLFHPAMGALALCGALMLLGFGALMRLRRRRARHRLAPLDHAASALAAALRGDPALVPRTRPWMRRLRRLERLRRARLAMRLRSEDHAAFLIALVRGGRQFLQSAMLALGAWLVITDRLDPAAMLASSVLLGRMLAPIERMMVAGPGLLAALKGWWHAAGGSGEKGGRAWQAGRDGPAGVAERTAGRAGRRAVSPRIRPAAPRKETVPRKGGECPAPGGALPLLELKGVRVDLPGRTAPILEGVDLTLPSGCVIGVTGANGSGKTLLAEIVCGRRRPDGGRVVFGPGLAHEAWFGMGAVEGRERLHAVGPEPAPSCSGNSGTPPCGLLSIGYAPQETGSTPVAMMQDLAFAGDDGEVRPAWERILAALGAPGLTALLMHALRESRAPPALSSGERRRLALARALCGPPRLVILDQPEEGLDAVGIAKLAALLGRRRQGEGAMLVLTGSRRLLGTCDAVMVLDRGRLHDAAVRPPPVGPSAGADGTRGDPAVFGATSPVCGAPVGRAATGHSVAGGASGTAPVRSTPPLHRPADPARDTSSGCRATAGKGERGAARGAERRPIGSGRSHAA